MFFAIPLRTVCNRTWFGDVGKTYEMEIDKPSALPFVCHLNFTAPGGSHGDIMQVSDIPYEVSQTKFRSLCQLNGFIRFFINLISSLC